MNTSTKISIDSDQVHLKSGTSRKTGKPFEIREQEAWLHVPGVKYPVKCRVSLADRQAAYPPGEYEVTRPLTVGQFDSLVASRDLGLVPITAQGRTAAVPATR